MIPAGHIVTGIYVLHAFQKKSRSGIAIPKEHIDMVKRRLRRATEIDAEIKEQEKKGKGRDHHDN